MIEKEIEKAINQQIAQEFNASFSYLAMAAWFEKENLSGFANWCKVQHEEEQQHAMRLFDYLLDRDGQVELQSMEKPRANYSSVLEVFQTALGHEQKNSKSIDELYRLASSKSDHATISHLQWFVDEQVEEEKMVGELLGLLERAGENVQALFYLNDKLASRTLEGEA